MNATTFTISFDSPTSLCHQVGIFFLGCGVSMQHGVSILLNPQPIDLHPIVPSVLAFSLCVEGATFAVAIREIRKHAELMKQSVWTYVREGADPNTTAVLAEDGAAVLGIFTAASCLSLTYLTGNAIFDAIVCGNHISAWLLSMGLAIDIKGVYGLCYRVQLP